MDPKTRKISSKGISAFGMHYTSKALHAAERVGKDGTTVEYSIRYDPDNISVIALFRDGHYIGDLYAKQMRLPDGTLLRLSVAQREMAKQLARDAGQPVRNWLRFTNQWHRISAERERELKARKRRQEAAEDRLSLESDTDIKTDVDSDTSDDNDDLFDHYDDLLSDDD
jgi:hypothetical protein